MDWVSIGHSVAIILLAVAQIVTTRHLNRVERDIREADETIRLTMTAVVDAHRRLARAESQE